MGWPARPASRRWGRGLWAGTALLVCLAAGCAATGSRGVFWAHPENLGELRVYEYGLNLDLASESWIDCGEGKVSRYCPEWGDLPEGLRHRILARRALGKSVSFGERDPAPEVKTGEGRLFFLAPYKESVFALDAQSGAPLWSSEAGMGFDCDAPLVLSEGRLYFACRHNLGREQSVFVMEAATGQPLAAYPLESAIATLVDWPRGALAVLADGSLWALGDGSGGPRLVRQLEDEFHRLHDPLPGPVRVPAPSAQTAQTLYLGGARGLWALERGGGELLWKRSVEARVQGLYAEPEAGALFVAGSDTSLLVLDQASGQERARWMGTEAQVPWFLATFGPSPGWDGLVWASGTAGGQVVFCDYVGLCYGVDPGGPRLRWAIKAGPRYRRLQPYLWGERLLLDFPPGRIVVVPGLPFSPLTQGGALP